MVESFTAKCHIHPIGKMIELLVCLAVFLIDNILTSDPSLIRGKSQFVIVGSDEFELEFSGLRQADL